MKRLNLLVCNATETQTPHHIEQNKQQGIEPYAENTANCVD